MPESRFSFADLVAAGVLAIGDGYRAKLEELGPGGPLFLRAGALQESGFVWDGLESFTSAAPVISKMGIPHDVVITTKGNSVGRVGWISESAPRFVYSPHLSYWRTINPDGLHARFLYFWSRGPEFAEQLKDLAHGTDMAPYLSLRDQLRLRITLPSFRDQQAIAEVLGALDDKIATNARVGQLIDEFCAATLDRLAKDASMTPLTSIASVVTEAVKPSKEGALRYLDISSVSEGSYAFPSLTPWSSAPGRARRRVARGDTVWSTVRPNRRSRALLMDDDPRIVCSTGLAVLRPHPGRIAGVYEATRRLEFVQYLESVAEGSAYPAVQVGKFADAPAPCLPPADWDLFESMALPLRERAHAANVESRRLAATRDELLPLLMSGRMTVRDAEEVAEAVT